MPTFDGIDLRDSTSSISFDGVDHHYTVGTNIGHGKLEAEFEEKFCETHLCCYVAEEGCPYCEDDLPPIWRTKKGEEIFVKDLTDVHVDNILKYFIGEDKKEPAPKNYHNVIHIVYLEKIKRNGPTFNENNMRAFFDALEALKGVKDSKKFHPEKSVFNHSLQVLALAFRESNDIDLILAAMLHDIGKAENTLGHEQIAVDWLQGLVSAKTIWLIQNHLRIWTYLSGEMRKLSKCQELVSNKWLPELIQLARWDKKGRVPNKEMKYDRKKIIEKLNKREEERIKCLINQ